MSGGTVWSAAPHNRRAFRYLPVTGIEPASEFLDGMRRPPVGTAVQAPGRVSRD